MILRVMLILGMKYWGIYIVFLCAFIVGHVLGEPVGYSAFGLLLTAVLCVLQIVIETLKNPIYFRFRRFCQWLSVAVVGLIFSGFLYSLKGTPDSFFVSEYSMLVLSFPLGVLSSFVHYSILNPFSGFSSLVVSWLIFVFFGALQWFIVFPAIVKKIGRNWRRK